MPRPRPPHLHREATRHGKIVWYVRIDRGPRIRIRAAFGTPGFDVAYQSAIEGRSPAEPPRASLASLQWLWDSYRQTGAWDSLRPATRRQRENIMLHVLKESGASPYTAVKQKHIVAGIDRRSKTPAQARNFLDVMKGLFRWAAERGHVAVDPTLGVKTPKRKRGDGFPSSTEDDVEAYQRRWPLGTRHRVSMACAAAMR